MSKKVAIIISPNWRDYAEKYLPDFIESLRGQNYAGRTKTFMADNETSDESFSLLKNIAPEIEIIRNKTNDGYAKGCNDAIRKALKDDFEYFAIFNIHTILEPDCLRKLVEVLEGADNIGLVQGRMMLYDGNPSAGSGCNKISSLGNKTHFLGFGYCEGYQEKWSGQAKNGQDIFYPSGSCIMAKREVLEKIGLFDEEYWMYNEDQELGWRARLSGWRCVLATDAVLYNKYEFKRSIKKYYWMDRNRILAILECYRVPTLIMIFPAFIAMEIGLIFFSLKQGWFKDKVRVWKYFFSLKNWRYILKARKRNQRLRKINDKDIAGMITGKIWYQEIGDWKLKLVNPVFQVYWWLAKKIIFW
ncbi:MAG: glycosyltransferase family 2 protein [Patescibacteria group bacterium]